MTYDPFDVVVVPFPFTDRPVTKKRPALVVSTSDFNSTHRQLIMAMITTAKQSDWPSDIPINDWSGAGLSSPCYIRLKLFTLDSDMIIRSVGTLSKKDRTAARFALKKFISFG